MSMENDVFWSQIHTPIGTLIVTGTEDKLYRLEFPNNRRKVKIHPEWKQDTSPFAALHQQLEAYFAGELVNFDLQLQPSGTDFQKTVWTALQDIPYGQTTSYGALAAAIGRPKASRAVGAANGANPIPIIIPCHRVIGADKSLTGFGGGVKTKALLLKLEGYLEAEPLLL